MNNIIKKLIYSACRKQIVFWFIVILFVIVVIESVLCFVSFSTNFLSRKVESNKFLLSPYEGKEWARDLFEEMQEVGIRYEQFLEWDRKSYRGSYVNIDTRGVRKTWNPHNFQRQAVKALYVFGGSTIWGHGARDENTIPSLLSKQLNASGYRFFVTNYGEKGYIFLQEILQLVLLLREGHRPDYVIFYDGVNDVYSAYKSGMAGTNYDYSSIKEKLEKSNKDSIIIEMLNVAKKHSMILETLSIIKNFFGLKQEFYYGEVAATFQDRQLLDFSRDIQAHYKKSINFLDYLSKAYGFKYLCLWQPNMFTETKVTEEEKVVDVKFKDRALSKLYNYVNNHMKTNEISYFFNISDVLSIRNKTIYLDCAHMSEEGNEIVADKIFQIFKKTHLGK
ncbi:SGNH/GDSL hydrolase family protein [Candidatus Omnitrophota bacterium]